MPENGLDAAASCVCQSNCGDYWRYTGRRRIEIAGFDILAQLLLPMAIGAGGEFRTNDPTGNTTSNMNVIQMFLKVRFELEKSDEGSYIIKIEK